MTSALATLPMAAATAAATAAVTAASALYLDAKYHITKDIGTIKRHKDAVKGYQRYLKKGCGSAFDFYLDNVKNKDNIEAIWTREGTLSFGELTCLIYKYANFFRSHNVKPGEFVALTMVNSQDMMAVWMALLAIGSAPAMINCSLKSGSLLHCIKVSEPRIILVDGEPDLWQRHLDIMDGLEESGITPIYLPQARDAIYNGDATAPPKSLRSGVLPNSPAGLFYTSGTTGMPKACVWPMMAAFIASYGGLNRHFAWKAPDGQDRLYNCMPIYHGTGGMAVFSQVVQAQSVCLGKKFSARNFWNDVRDSGATWFSYVGEVLRYLVAAPPTPRDKEHRVHTAFGNGLRPDVWEAFKKRFGIDLVVEIFASTESIMMLVNFARGPYFTGCVGHHGALFRWMTRNLYIPVAIDPETGGVWRHPKTGFAKRVPLIKAARFLYRFLLRCSLSGTIKMKRQHLKKYLRDVFKKGDQYYRTGDALRRDNEGRWFFMDRLGDTFRWKGENVSTQEVSEVIGRFPGVIEAAVYGVKVPGREGRAGSVGLLIDKSHKETFDWAGLLKHLRSRLPEYAVPVFVRILPQSIASHNFKLNKMPLQNAGVDPAKTGSAEIRWIEGLGRGSTYVPFGKVEWNSLVAGRPKI